MAANGQLIHIHSEKNSTMLRHIALCHFGSSFSLEISAFRNVKPATNTNAHATPVLKRSQSMNTKNGHQSNRALSFNTHTHARTHTDHTDRAHNIEAAHRNRTANKTNIYHLNFDFSFTSTIHNTQLIVHNFYPKIQNNKYK